MSAPQRKSPADELRTFGNVCLIGAMMLISMGGMFSRAASIDYDRASLPWFLTYGVALALYSGGYLLLKKWKRLP